MATAQRRDIGNDRSGLYREESLGSRVGQQRLPPYPSGATDTAPVLYLGQTRVLTPAGAYPAWRCRRLRSTCVAKFGKGRSALARTMRRRNCAAKSVIDHRTGTRHPARSRGPAVVSSAERHGARAHRLASPRGRKTGCCGATPRLGRFATSGHEDLGTATWFQARHGVSESAPRRFRARRQHHSFPRRHDLRNRRHARHRTNQDDD